MLSPVFYDIFKANFEVTKQIPVSFALYDGFLECIRFIYTSEYELTVENVCDVLKIAKKYSLEFLQNDCADYIVKSITVESASHFLENSITNEQTDLQNNVIQFIAPNIASILKTTSFLTIEKQTLETIISIDEVGPITEMEIFNGVMKWAENKCIENKLIVNGENKRCILGDLIKQIRFKKMTSMELGQLIKEEKGLLTSDEVQDLFLSICTNDISNFGFQNDERKQLIDLNTIKEKNIYPGGVIGCSWVLYNNIRNPKERTKFTVNKMIYLTKIYAAYSKLSQNVNIQILNDQNIILFEKTTQSKSKCRTYFDVTLTPLLINPNREYFIHIKYENTLGTFYCDGQQTLPVTRSNEGIEFLFTELSQLLRSILYKTID